MRWRRRRDRELIWSASCIQKHEEDGWFQNVLLGLASEAQMSALELVEGDRNEQMTRVAWAARNLLELHYWTRFVLTSSEDTQRFREDILCDYREMMNRLKGLPDPDSAISVAEFILAKAAEQLHF
jgi:hypothetical protein